jgi:hypothetical protein
LWAAVAVVVPRFGHLIGKMKRKDRQFCDAAKVKSQEAGEEFTKNRTDSVFFDLLVNGPDRYSEKRSRKIRSGVFPLRKISTNLF